MCLDDPAGRVLGHLLIIDEIAHLLAGGGIGTIHIRLLACLEQRPPILRGHFDRSGRRADGTHEAKYLNAELL
jgi:hypothetical protein